MELLYKELSYDVVGAAMSVHRELKWGFLEKVYQEAFAIELKMRNIPFEREKNLELTYKGQKLNSTYIADFVIDNKIIVELKATDGITSSHISQTLNYLNATGLSLGIIINFGTSSLQYERVINNKNDNPNS
ncbi:MAG: GxxExxY protein [Bacteroidales bacterium]|nr:GxxExxY protein [Candidatus Physcocola equi]